MILNHSYVDKRGGFTVYASRVKSSQNKISWGIYISNTCTEQAIVAYVIGWDIVSKSNVIIGDINFFLGNSVNKVKINSYQVSVTLV